MEKSLSDINIKIVHLNDDSDNKIKEISNLKCINDKKQKVISEVNIVLINY